MDAQDQPARRTYNRKETNSGEHVPQKADIDIGTEGPAPHGESIITEVPELNAAHMAKLRMNEDPVTIRIEENSRSDFPETHVPVSVQGKGAEVLTDQGKWIEVGWLPINQVITTKRKYAEVLICSRADSISTQHDDATVEKPRNLVRRRSSSNYPVSIIEDKSPLSRQWLSDLMNRH